MIESKCILLSISFLVIFNGLQAMEPAPLRELPLQLKIVLVELKKNYSFMQTSATDCRKYGYNGIKVPVFNGRQGELKNIGYIIAESQPAMFWGLLVQTSSIPLKRFFLEENNLTYKAEIKERKTDTKIHSSYLVSDGTKNTMAHELAILWEDGIPQGYGRTVFIYTSVPLITKLYITLIRLAEVQQNDNQIDLDQNKVEVKL
jgi:hypothetical protein